MTLSLLYRLVRRVIEVPSVHRMDDVAKDAAILVLRHQLAVPVADRGDSPLSITEIPQSAGGR